MDSAPDEDGRGGEFLERRINQTRRELSQLMERLDAGGEDVVVKDALVALNTTLGQLEISSEELRAQNEELAAAQQELVRQRRRYRQLFALAPEAYLVTDANGTILESNRQAELLLGRPADRMVGKPIVVFVPEPDRPVFRARLNAMSVMEVRGLEMRLVGGDGQPIRVAATVQSGDTEAGDTELRWILTSSEALDLVRKDLDRLLNRARQDVDHLETIREWQSTLLGAAAHDLRTPLAVVSASLETLLTHRASLQEDRAGLLLERAYSHAAKLRRVLTGLLEISRLELSGNPANRAPLVLEPVMQRVRDLLDIGAHGLVIELDGVEANVDEVLVERVLENLVRNALEHSPSSCTIWVRAEVDDGDVTLIVEDDGPGVADDFKDDVFLPFVQARRVGDVGGSTGLGLAIVSMFAAFHGGRAWVQDREGGGASFRVHLPGAATGAARA